MKSLTFRFANADILILLRKKIIDIFLNDQMLSQDEYLVHPIFYTRISRPGIFQSNQRRMALLDTQPHFDRSFNVEAFSFWLAMDDADNTTGGLCFFSESPKLFKEFGTR
jgi:hypothetical protein